MPPTLDAPVLWVPAAYLLAGIVFAPLFAWLGAARLDPGARGASLWFRVLILPGSAALWPLLLIRWVRASRTVHTHSGTEASA